MTREGVDAREADVYAEGVKRGGALVSVRTEEADVEHIERILNERATVDPGARRAEYESAGWTGYRDSLDEVTTAGAARGGPGGMGTTATGGAGTTGIGVGGVEPAGGPGRDDRAAGTSADLAHAARGEREGPGALRPRPGSEGDVDRDLKHSTIDPDLDPPPRG